MATEAKTDEKAIVKQEQNIKSDLAFLPTEENIKLLKDTLVGQNVNLTDPELKLVLYQANKTGLDPLARQIYALKTGGKLSLMTSIDGQRLVAQRTGQYEGQVGPQWCGKDGVWRDVWLEDGNPMAARVGVMRTGFKEPLYGVARWKSYANENSPTWKKMGDVMLAKCAEALALRKSFPQELSGLYTQEEMNQADAPRETIDHDTGEITPSNTPAKSDKPKTVKQIFTEITEHLDDRKFTEKSDQKLIIQGMAGVTDLTKIKLNDLLEVQKAIESSGDDKLKNFLPVEGQVVDPDAGSGVEDAD